MELVGKGVLDVVHGDQSDVHDNFKGFLVSVRVKELQNEIDPEANLNDEVIGKILLTERDTITMTQLYTVV